MATHLMLGLLVEENLTREVQIYQRARSNAGTACHMKAEGEEFEPGWVGANAVLISLPILAMIIGMFAGLYYELVGPFGALIVQDVFVVLGGPIMVVGIWLAWFWIVRSLKIKADVWMPVTI